MSYEEKIMQAIPLDASLCSLFSDLQQTHLILSASETIVESSINVHPDEEIC